MKELRPLSNNTKAIGKYEEYTILEEGCLDLKERRIYLVGDIAAGVIESVVQQIHYLSSPRHCTNFEEPIYLIINSLGGHDDMMLYLYDAIVNCPTDIITIGSGLVCSAATLVLVAGVDRYATENCMFMTHKGHAALAGDEDEISAQAEFNKKISDRYWKLMGRHTKLSGQQWYNRSKSDGEHWLETKGMLLAGVIDGVIAPAKRELDPLPKRRIKTRAKKHDEHEEEDEYNEEED